MKSWTYTEALDKVERELDLKEENLIYPSEMMDYFNEAIDQAEAIIHSFGLEDEYFLASQSIALTSGDDTYDVPSTLYANKIREIVYASGTDIFEIKRLRVRGIREIGKFTQLALRNSDPGATPRYQYFIKNNTQSEGRQIVFTPPAQETSASNVTVWFIRNANEITADSDVFDIPEFMNFIFQYVKNKCKSKEGILTAQDVADLAGERQLMIDTLQEMVPDGDNVVEPDLSVYEEMS